MSTSILSSRPIVLHIRTTCSKCSVNFEFAPPTPHPRPGTLLQVRCFSCQNVNTHAFYPTQLPSVPQNQAQKQKQPTRPDSRTSHASTSRAGGRKIGTQENPLDTAYYDLLGVPVTATTDDIKKAYRRLAIKHHPDKNPDDPQAEERFKAIAIAYQTLSDPALRSKYNEFGPKEGAPEGGFVDPEEIFSAMFGGEKFVPIIGHISLARDMKTALQEPDEQGGEGKEVSKVPKTPEEKAAKEAKDRKKAEEKALARKQRVSQLVENLTRKLSVYTESSPGPDTLRSYQTICEIEAEQLKSESYGPELLQCIGFVYVQKAKASAATNQSFLGVGGWLHNVQGKYHVFSETMSTVRAAIELKNVFEQLQAAEKAGNLTDEERRKLEEDAAEKGVKAMFKGTKLEIESVLRETCDLVLAQMPPDRGPEALRILGEAYLKAGSTTQQQQQPRDEDEYVRVDVR